MKHVLNAIPAMLVIVSYSLLLILSKQTAGISESGDNFVVKFPKILDLAARLIAIVGVLMEIIFLYKLFQLDSKIIFSHFIIGAVFLIIGIVVEFIYVRWNIVVEENVLTCNRVFKSSEKLNIEDLDLISIPGEIIRLSVDNKTITYVDKDCDNFDLFCNKLSECGKINE